MGTHDLPDRYTLALGPNDPCAQAYISGKSLMPMLQLLHMYQWISYNLHVHASPVGQEKKCWRKSYVKHLRPK